MGIRVAFVIIVVAFFRTVWPFVYPSIVNLNQYPTAEYFRIMWLLSPNGLSSITIIVGCILIAWVAYIER
jgi:hypothetical protein